VNITIEKTVALVIALAKLHNCSINANGNDISANTASDEWISEINGDVPLVPLEGHDDGSPNVLVPEELLHGGEHFEDVGRRGRRQRERCYNAMSNAPLPREQLHSYIAEIGVTRPSVARC
jgi:hypothetical protein